MIEISLEDYEKLIYLKNENRDLKDQLKNAWKSEAMPKKLPPLGKWGGFKTLEEGVNVEFEVAVEPKGARAVNVNVIS